MHVSAFKQSKYLTRADVGSGALVTIRELAQENISKEGAPEELKWAMYFDECEKPLLCNPTNAQIIASILKSEESDDWIGQKVVLYDDPTVSFGGKLVGGIRVRAPRGKAAAPAATKPASAVKSTAAIPPSQLTEPPEEDASDSVPF